VLLLATIVALRRPGLSRAAAIAMACTLALYAAELTWPRLGAPFALSHGYAFMACVCLAPACLIARLPARVAFAIGTIVLLAWAALAAGKLQTFSSHVALWDDAVRRAERAGPKPEDARVYLNRAAVHRREGHLIAAIADYDKAIALDPDQPRALRGRAQAYIDDKRYEAALRDLDRLLELDPSQAITHADRGLALMHAGRLAEAGSAFDRAIAQGATEPRVFLNRGLARLQLSGLESASLALADIEKALSLDPNYALAYFNRGVIFEEAAKAGMRLRDAVSPELMRAVGAENIARACRLGYAQACARARGKTADEPPPGAKEGPMRVTPETLRSQGLLPAR